MSYREIYITAKKREPAFVTWSSAREWKPALWKVKKKGKEIKLEDDYKSGRHSPLNFIMCSAQTCNLLQLKVRNGGGARKMLTGCFFQNWGWLGKSKILMTSGGIHISSRWGMSHWCFGEHGSHQQPDLLINHLCDGWQPHCTLSALLGKAGASLVV